MAFSELSTQELYEQLRIYMASPEGGIRPEIYALYDFCAHSVCDSDGKISTSPSDGYDVANLFWDLHQPSRLVPHFDEDFLESLESHVLLCRGVWQGSEGCAKWLNDQINRLTETHRRILESPLEPDWKERTDHVTKMMLFAQYLHDAERIRSESRTRSDSDCKVFVLEFLDWLYEGYKISYEPDGESGGTFDLDAYLHIATARAFRIKQGQGFSDDVRNLSEVEGTVTHIEAEGNLNSEEIIAPCHSTQAVAALAYVEISRVSRIDGDFVAALHYLAKAAEHYDFVVLSNDELIGSPDYMRFLYGDRFDIDLQLRRKLEASLTGLQVPLDEAASIFTSIKESPSNVDSWRQIADDCRTLKNAYFVSGREDDISDEYDDIVTWEGFWSAAQAWTSAQLSPSEYRRMREGDNKDAAERRLRNYFFGSNWSSLPERAQESLISADSTWNSAGRVRRESILNELLRATEEMCELFVFQPLMNEERTISPILSIEAKVADRRRSLGVREYIDICKLPSLPSLLSDRSLADGEIRFMTEDLPASMRNLADARNPAEHDTGASIPMALVESAYQLFLGIGRKGVLPELARIGRKLQSQRR